MFFSGTIKGQTAAPQTPKPINVILIILVAHSWVEAYNKATYFEHWVEAYNKATYFEHLLLSLSVFSV